MTTTRKFQRLHCMTWAPLVLHLPATGLNCCCTTCLFTKPKRALAGFWFRSRSIKIARKRTVAVLFASTLLLTACGGAGAKVQDLSVSGFAFIVEAGIDLVRQRRLWPKLTKNQGCLPFTVANNLHQALGMHIRMEPRRFREWIWLSIVAKELPFLGKMVRVKRLLFGIWMELIPPCKAVFILQDNL